jgi:hypothetical protein
MVVEEGLAGLLNGASDWVEGDGEGERESRRLNKDGDRARGVDGTGERWTREDVIIV